MTRKFQAALFAFALLAALPGLAQTATAPAAGATITKIGVIDIQAAILNTNEGQRETNALATRFQPKQTELQNLNKEVEDLKKQLEVQDGKLSDDARANMLRNIEQKQKNLQRSYEDAQAEFDNQKNEILKTLGNKVYAVLDKYAKDNAYSLIVDVSNPQSPILWASQATNVTKAIVDAYNAQSNVAPQPKPAAATTPASKPSGTGPSASKSAAKSTTPH